MTAPEGFSIFTDGPLISEVNSNEVRMQFRRLQKAVLNNEGEGDPATIPQEENSAHTGNGGTDKQKPNDPLHWFGAINSGLWTG